MCALMLHSIFPELLPHYASEELFKIFKELSLGGNKILIRFNTKWQEDPLKRTWRVLINGEEKLASEVCVEVPSQSTVEDVAPGVTEGGIKPHPVRVVPMRRE
jgi:hypothetical protein